MGKDRLTINEAMEDLKNRIRERDPDAFREQPFRKGQYLSDFQSDNSIGMVLKVVATSQYSVLVRDLSYTTKDSIPFTLQKKLWDKFKPMTKDEVKKWKNQKIRSKIWQAGMDAGTFVSKTFNLSHTTQPQKASEYAANFVAFVVTYSARKQTEVYFPEEPNLFEGLFAHGPIYPGQKIK